MAKRRAPKGVVIDKSKPEHEQLAQAYHNTFSSESGSVVLADLEQRYGRRRSFAPDPHTTAFHEGQRDVYLMILNLLDKE